MNQSVMGAMGQAVAKGHLRPMPKSLFRPGAGCAPPLLAGRDELLGEIQEGLIDELAAGEAPLNAFLLHGPRGVGKTCLLAETSKRIQALRGRTGAEIRIIRLTRAMLASPQALAQRILGKAGLSPTKTRKGGGGGVKGFAHGHFEREWDHRFGLGTEQILKSLASRQPLLLMLDEVQAVEGEQGEAAQASR